MHGLAGLGVVRPQGGRPSPNSMAGRVIHECVAMPEPFVELQALLGAVCGRLSLALDRQDSRCPFDMATDPLLRVRSRTPLHAVHGFTSSD